jgi:hypothetical protein
MPAKTTARARPAGRALKSPLAVAEAGERNRTVILAAGEAHLLTTGQLEALRMMTSHNLDSGSPLSILLIGQPTIRRRLRLGDMAALDQRVQLRCVIPSRPSPPTRPAATSERTFPRPGTATRSSPTTPSASSTPTPAACPAPSTASPSPHCSPAAPRTRPSPMSNPPAPPSPRTPQPRQTDHHNDTTSTTAPARQSPDGANFTPFMATPNVAKMDIFSGG